MVSDEELQRYFDGELSEAEARSVEAQLTDIDRARLKALEEMRALLNAALDGEAAEVDVWSGVEAKLKEERAEATRRWRERRRGGRRSLGLGLKSMAGFAAAMAAAFFVIVQPWPGGSRNDCSIETLETEGAIAAIFNDDDDNAPTVIWSEETEEEEN